MLSFIENLRPGRNTLSCRFQKYLRMGVVLSVVPAIALPVAAQEVKGRYYNANGSRTDDLEKAAATWRADKEFQGNWGLKAINADAAYARGYTGLGSIIGVIDQPVLSKHPEFAKPVGGKAKSVFIPTSGTYLYADPYMSDRKPGVPFLYEGQLYVEGNYRISDHGIHVAGIAAANRDTVAGNPGIMQGVAYNAGIIAADNGDPGPEDGVVSGNDGSAYAAAWKAMIDNRVDVITNSWGIGIKGDKWRFTQAAIQFEEIKAILGKAEGGAYDGAIKAARSGIIIEFSAGNDDGADPDALAGLPTFVPDLEKNWITTMSVAEDGKRSNSSSNCGYTKYFCVAAPGYRNIQCRSRG